MVRLARFVLLLAALSLALSSAIAQTLERRETYAGEAAEPRPGLFRDKCGKCHARAGPLVRDRLSLAAGVLVISRNAADLRAFMRGHFGAPGEAEIETIYNALRRIAQGKGRFRERCGICHDSAEELARQSLILRDDALTGRYTGRNIAEFLLGHGTEDAQEAAFFKAVLERQLTGGP